MFRVIIDYLISIDEHWSQTVTLEEDSVRTEKQSLNLFAVSGFFGSQEKQNLIDDE